jgi:hypothetical protein
VISQRVRVGLVVVVGLPFVEMVGDIVSSVVGCGVFKVDDDELMVFRGTRRERLFQLEDVAILRVVVWSTLSAAKRLPY